MNITVKSRNKVLQLDTAIPGIRLDKYITQVFPHFSRSYIQKLIEQGHILVDGREAKASQKLNSTSRITIQLPPLPPTQLVAEPVPLNIVFENEDVLIIDKPAGLTVHPAPGHPNHTLVNALLTHCPSLAMSNDLVRPGIVHRLDKDTSGLIVIAKNDLAKAHLVNQFKSHTVAKGYLVLVKGKVFPQQGIIEAPVGRDPRNRQRMAIVENGREASTQYQVKESLSNHTLLEVTPRTGRTHQIRVHLSAIGYPVVGDSVYGSKSAYTKRQFIHAHRLGFRLPSTNEYREFTCPLPADLEQALETLSHNI